MHAHLVQLDITWENKQANFARVRALIDAAPPDPYDLIVLPEMFDTGFSLNCAATADNAASNPALPPAPSTLAFLIGLAAQHHVFVHGSRTIIGPDGRGRNLATIAAPDGTLHAEYAKVHPFSYGNEAKNFTGGDTVITYSWSRPGSDPLSVCPAICYDLRFPELFRRGLLQGAHLFAVGANWPAVRASHWRALLIARAIENQAYVLGVNRCGSDPNLAYAGGSIAVGPRGEVLRELGPNEEIARAPIDPAAVLDWRREFPAWRDIRLFP